MALMGILLLLFGFIFPAFGQESAKPAGAAKRVEVDKTRQILRAFEGDRVVLQCRVSTGKWDKATPNGQYVVGDKERMHRSKLFHNAPMPFSVYVTGNVFIHGFTEVPHHPASHGCIRVPLSEGNPAMRFYEWVEPGTPVEVIGHWGG